MRGKTLLLTALAVCVLLTVLLTSGVLATWVYYTQPEPMRSDISNTASAFRYGEIYIVSIGQASGDATAASLVKTADTKAATEVTLKPQNGNSASFEVTFYNGSDVTYYYNKTEALSWSNDNIVFSVSGIEQKEAIAPKSYKTVTVTVAYKNNTASASNSVTGELNFLFVVDKDSIGVVVARTILDRFRDILNNVVAPDSYLTLDTAMDNRTGWNKASDVTFIGNVVGSNSDDTVVLESLFGDELTHMDLDGDGKMEEITIMIKRENLDANDNTGDTYSYTNRNQVYSVHGAEMSIYITSDKLNTMRRGDEAVVYAAVFTKLPGASQWTMMVPLTKGTAAVNSYTSGDYFFGSADSFNTSKWTSDEGATLGELAKQK